ncbi:hypothetical protein [Acidovorax sp. GW101-3H11]|uniref:hypothetical protein n=1 Tax=Acidovorax sp. GW101-3H11 TaxID=1813946 RepID=UPI000A7F268F|nr:hypothetical protein [Acidovorax sp. GW101-3H11]
MGCRKRLERVYGLASINVHTNTGPAGVVAFSTLLLVLLVLPVVRRATAAIAAQPD